MSKKLLIQLGVISLMGSSFATPFSSYYNSNHQALLDENIIKDNVLFIPDIDGSSLKTGNQTYGDGLKLLNKYIQNIESSSKVVLQNEKLLTKEMQKGNNTFFVKIVVGQESKLAIARLINIKLSVSERIQEIVNFLNKTIDGSKLSTSISYASIIKFANILANNKDHKANIILNNNKESNNLLKQGRNIINVKVQIGSQVVNHRLILDKVLINNDSFYETVLNKFNLDANIVDAKGLTTLDLYSDAFNLIKKHIEKVLPIAQVHNINSSKHLTILKSNNLQIEVSITVGTINKKVLFTVKNIRNSLKKNSWSNLIQFSNFKSSLTNVLLPTFLQQEPDEDLRRLNEIKEDIEDSLTMAANLNSQNTILDGFNFWLQELGNEFSDATFSLNENVDKEQKLQEDVNNFLVDISLNGKTITASPGIANVILLDNDRLDRFEKYLETSFDGGTLDTSNTANDAFKIISPELRKKDWNVSFELVATDIDKALVAGENNLNIIIKSGAVSRQVTAKINNVKLANLDRIKEVIRKLSQDIVDGSSLNSTNSKINSLDLIKEKVKQLDESVEVTISEQEGQMKLVQGLNEVEVTLKIGEDQMTTKVKVSDVVKSDADTLSDVISNLESNGVDGKNLLTSNTVDDALQLIITSIKNDNSNVNVELVYPNTISDKLVENTNIISINLTLNGITRQVNVTVRNVKLSNVDRIKVIQEKFNDKSIVGNILTTNNTINDAFNSLILDDLKKSDPDAEFLLVSDPNTKLVKGDNDIKINVKIGEELQEITVRITDVMISDDDQLDLIVTEFNNKEIDGSMLTTKSTNQDLLDIVTKLIKATNSKVDVKLKDETIINEKVNNGENSIDLIIKIGDLTRELKVNFKDIEISVKDRLAKIINYFKNNKVDNTSLNADDTSADTLKIIQDKITADLDPTATIKVVTDDSLYEGENVIEYKLTIDGEESDLIVTIINVKPSPSEKLSEIEQWLLSHDFDGSAFTTANNVGDTLSQVIKEIKEKFPDAKITLNLQEQEQRKLLSPHVIFNIDIEIDGKTITVPIKVNKIRLSDADTLNIIRNKLVSDNVNGASLTTDHTIADALKLIEDSLIKDYPNLKVVPGSGSTDLTTKLVAGTNNIEVTIKIGNKTQKFTVAVQNITLSDKDKLDTFVKSLVDNTIDGNSLTTNQNLVDALKLIRDKYGNPEMKFNLVDDANPNSKLKENNEVKVVVKINDQAVELTFNVINVKLTAQDRLNKFIAKFNNNDIDGSDLTTNNTIVEAIKDIKTAMESFDNEVAVNLEGDPTAKLVAGNNEIKFKIIVEGIEQEISVKVNNVVKSDEDMLSEIIAKINETKVDGSSLDTSKKINDALDLIREKMKTLYPDVIVNLTNKDDALKILNEGNNEIAVTIDFKGQTRNINVTVENVPLSSADLIAEIIEMIKDKKIDGSSFTTDDSYEKVLELVQEEINKIKPGTKVELLDKDESNKKLVKGENKIKVKITSGEDSKTTVVTIDNIIVSDKDVIDNIEKELNIKKSELEKGLTTENTIGDYIKKLEEIAKAKDKDAKITTDMDLNQKLTDLPTDIVFNIVLGEDSKVVTHNVERIRLSDKQILKLIREQIKIIDGSNLNSGHSKKHTLELLKEVLKDLKEKYKFKFDLKMPNTESGKKLQLGDNIINYIFEINDLKGDGKAKVTGVTEDPNKERFDHLIKTITGMKIDIPEICVKPDIHIKNDILRQLKEMGVATDGVTIESLDIPDLLSKTSSLLKRLLGNKKYLDLRVKVTLGEYHKSIVVKYFVDGTLDICLEN